MPTESERSLESLLLFAMLFWIAGMPTFWLPANHATAFIPVLKAERVAYLAVVGVLATSLFVRRAAPRRPSTLDIAVAAYLAIVIVSWLGTVSSKDAPELKGDVNLLLTCLFMPFTAYFAARRIEWTPDRVRLALWTVVLGAGAVLTLIGLVQTLYDQGFLVRPTIVAHRDRTMGTFSNGVPYGITMSIFLMVTLFLGLRSKGLGERVGSIALAGAMALCVIGSKTRIVWVAVLVAFGLLAFRVRKLRVLLAIPAAALAVLLFAVALGTDPWQLRSRALEKNPVYDRIALTATSIKMIRDRPLLGFGFGMNTFDRAKVDYYASWGSVSPRWAEFPYTPHNGFLTAAVLMGVLGLLAYLALMVASWRALASACARQGGADPFAAELALFVQGAFLVLFLSGQLHDVTMLSFPQVLFFLLLGMAVTPAAPARAGGER